LLDVSRQLENAHLDGQHIVRIEPEIDVHHSSKACQEQSRADEKHDGPAKAGLNRALVPLGVGDYTVTLDVAGQSLTKPARVRERLPRSY
jgi:hypothetical protein